MSLKDAMAKQPNNKVTAFKIETWKIHPDPQNAVLYGIFDPEHNAKDAELVDSLQQVNLIQPITVRPHPTLPEEYVIVSGHRRHAAHVYAHIPYIACYVLRPESQDDLLRLEAALVQTNTTTRDRTPEIIAREIDYMEATMKKLKEADPERYAGRIRSMVADKVGVSERTVATVQKIKNNVSPETFEKYTAGEISQKEASSEADRVITSKTNDLVLYQDAAESVRIAVQDAFYSNIPAEIKDKFIISTVAFKDYCDQRMKSHGYTGCGSVSVQFKPGWGAEIKTEGNPKVRLMKKDMWGAASAADRRNHQTTIPPKPETKPTETKAKTSQIVEPESNDDDSLLIVSRLTKKLEDCIARLADNPALAKNDAIQTAVFTLATKIRSADRNLTEVEK
jgi:hypothetical protein